MEFPKMTAVCVCGGCGRTIEKDYVFCPWCGRSRVTDEDLFLIHRFENQTDEGRLVVVDLDAVLLPVLGKIEP